MMLYRNTKVKVHSPDWETDFFNIVFGVFQEDTMYQLIIWQDYVVRTSIDLKKNGFTLKKNNSEADILQKLLQSQTMQMI